MVSYDQVSSQRVKDAGATGLSNSFSGPQNTINSCMSIIYTLWELYPSQTLTNRHHQMKKDMEKIMKI